MSEPCPMHLDDEGKSLWEQCDWIISGGAFDPVMPLMLAALAIRRELRQESALAAERLRADRLEAALRHIMSANTHYSDETLEVTAADIEAACARAEELGVKPCD